MTDATGTVVWRAYYEPFGTVSSITGSLVDNQRFPGQWFELEAGLHYNWHRHYDPTLGRYTSPDPLGVAAGASLFGYVRQSPQMLAEARGLDNPSMSPHDPPQPECPGRLLMFSELRFLLGKQIDAVIFVQDYFQLRFDVTILSILVPISIRTCDRVISEYDLEYRDLICSRINSKLKDIIYIDLNKFEMEFEHKYFFTINISDEFKKGPEALVLWSDGIHVSKVW